LILWLEFIDTNDNDFKEIGFEAGIKSDAPTTISVALWGYSNAMNSGGKAWFKSDARN